MEGDFLILIIMKNIFPYMEIYTGYDKSRFTVVSTQNTVYSFIIFIIVLFFIQIPVNTLLPHPVEYTGNAVLRKIIKSHFVTVGNIL